MRRLLILLIAAAAVLAACGTSGGTKTTAEDPPADPAPADPADPADPSDPEPEPDGPMAEEYEMAVVEQLTTAEEGELNLTQSEAECVAPKWVAAMTVEALEDAGVTTEELADTDFNPGDLELGPEAGAALAGAFGECDVDIVALAIESLAAGDAQLEACVTDNLDADALLDLLGRDLGGEDTDAEFDEIFAPVEVACEPG